MAIPLNLSEVPDIAPYVQYVAASNQTVFPYPFPITQDSDLIVVVNGVTLNTDTGYTLSGQGNDTGGNLTFTLGQTPGTIVTLYRDIAIERLTQISQNSGFSSTAFNAEFNNLYLIAQQLESAIAQCLQIPNTNNPAPTTVLTPLAYAGKYLSFDSYGNPQPAVLTSSGTLTQSIIGSLLYPTLEYETGVVNEYVGYGIAERFGAVGDGATDDTNALTNWIASGAGKTLYGSTGRVYGVQTITFPQSGPKAVYFNGSRIRGIASEATNAVVVVAGDQTSFYDYFVDGNLNASYLCGTWWYNAGAPAQYINVFGMTHLGFVGAQTGSGTTIRAMIYGALVGNASTDQAQSENYIAGWRTIGCQNPCYLNHSNGRLSFSGAIFVANNDLASGSFSWANARALEVQPGGLYYVKGGEIQFSGGSGQTYAAELANVWITDVSIESPVPININGRVYITGGDYQMTQEGVSAYHIATGAQGDLHIERQWCFAPSGAGSSSNAAMINASLSNPTATFTESVASATSGTLTAAITAGAYNVIFSNGERRYVTVASGGTAASWSGALEDVSITTMVYNLYDVYLDNVDCLEWAWIMAGRAAVLVNSPRGIHMKNVRVQQTGSDPFTYTIDIDPTRSLLDAIGYDPIGYSTTGWVLDSQSGSSSIAAGTNAGPPGSVNNQIVVTSTGDALGLSGDPTSLDTCEATMWAVKPGEKFYLEADCQRPSGGNGQLIAQFFDATGATQGLVSVADASTIPNGSWAHVSGPFNVPALSAYMAVGLFANDATVWGTNFKVCRA